MNLTSMLENICSNLHSLVRLDVDVFYDFIFPSACKHLTNLTSVHLLVHTYMHFRSNSFFYIAGLPITELSIEGTDYNLHAYKPLDKNFLLLLSKLRSLHIKDFTVFVSDIMRIILQPLENSTMNMITMNFYLGRDIVILRNKDLHYLKTICLKVLDLQWMRIQYIDFRILRHSRLFDCLEELNLSFNFLVNVIESIVFVPILPKIQRVNVCCQLLMEGMNPDGCGVPGTQYTRDSVSYTGQEMVAPSMYSMRTTYVNPVHRASYGDWINFVINSDRSIAVDFYMPDSVTYFTASNRDCQGLAFNVYLTIHSINIKELQLQNMNFRECNGSLRGMQNLKKLEITNWRCTILNSKFLVGLQSLEYLTFSSVKLGDNAERMRIFANLTHLRYVDIACNSITDLHAEFFESQVESLENLSLANNLLRHIPKSVFELNQLQNLDLRMNLISSLAGEAIEFLNKNDGLFLQLAYNDLHCTCNELQFLYWIKINSHRIQDYEDLQCSSDNGVKVSLPNAVRNVSLIELRCVAKSWLYFAIFGNIFVLLCISLVFTLVKFQADVLYTLTRIRRYIFKRNRTILGENQYHAFVSYGDVHYQWSVNDLRLRLESKGFRLLLPDLHFDIGRDHVDNILDAIDQSKRVIFVLTKDFLANEWNEFQIQIARIHAFRNQNENFVIVILRDDMKLHEVPESLKRIWIRVNCLRWPSDNDPGAVQLFWKQLEQGLSEDLKIVCSHFVD